VKRSAQSKTHSIGLLLFPEDITQQGGNAMPWFVATSTIFPGATWVGHIAV
jgi:hypothetical protein